MTNMRHAKGFKQDLENVTSDRVLEMLFRMLELLEAMPRMGSQVVRPGIAARHGNSLHHLVVSSFDIIYACGGKLDEVRVMGLVPQHTVR